VQKVEPLQRLHKHHSHVLLPPHKRSIGVTVCCAERPLPTNCEREHMRMWVVRRPS